MGKVIRLEPEEYAKKREAANIKPERKPNGLDSGSAVVQANSRAKGTRRIAGGIRRPYETVEGSPSYDRARPAHAAGCRCLICQKGNK